MAATLRLKLALNNLDTSTCIRDFEIAASPNLSRPIGTKLARLIEAMCGGSQPGSINVATYSTTNQATGTVTAASVQAADTITINGVVFTAIASGATGNQFNLGMTDTATAANIATVINASVTALIPGYVTATSALGVVTIRSAFDGIAGNMTTLASSNNTRLAVSGARLAGGTADSSTQTYQF